MKVRRNESFTILVLIAIGACCCHIGVLAVMVYVGLRQGWLVSDIFATFFHAADQAFFILNFILAPLSVISFSRYRMSLVGTAIVIMGSSMMGILNILKVPTNFLALFYLCFWIALPYALIKDGRMPNQAL